MNASKLIMLLLLIGYTAGASADDLETWGDGVQYIDYLWYPTQRELVIINGDNLNYKFWVHDGGDDPSTGVIDSITVDPNAAGDFSLTIGYPADPNDPNSPLDPNTPGALNWNEGDLEYAGGTSTVVFAKLAGAMAATDKTVELDQVDGTIDVAGSVDTLEIDELDGSIEMDINGQISDAVQAFTSIRRREAGPMIG